jgi:hypothetical protein
MILLEYGSVASGKFDISPALDIQTLGMNYMIRK